MFLKKIDKKKTYRNVQAFFHEDFDQIKYLSSAESLIKTNDPSKESHKGNNSNDSLNINQYSYKKLYGLILKAIEMCPDPDDKLLTMKYLDHISMIKIASKLHCAETTLVKWQRRAFVEFANSLFVLTSQIKPESPIDFRIYED